MKSWQFKLVEALGVVALILLCGDMTGTQWAVFIVSVLAIAFAAYGDGLREKVRILEDIYRDIQDAQESLRREINERNKSV